MLQIFFLKLRDIVSYIDKRYSEIKTLYMDTLNSIKLLNIVSKINIS